MSRPKRRAAADTIWTADDDPAPPPAREAWLEAELNYAAKAWRDAQSWPAVGEAFDLCRNNGAPLPDWLGEAISEILNGAFSQGAKGKGGRHAAPNWRAFDRQVHYAIYCDVEDLRIEQEIKAPSDRLTLKQILNEIALRPRKGLGRARDTVEKTYKRVRADIKAGKGHLYFDGGRRIEDEARINRGRKPR